MVDAPVEMQTEVFCKRFFVISESIVDTALADDRFIDLGVFHG